MAVIMNCFLIGFGNLETVECRICKQVGK